MSRVPPHRPRQLAIRDAPATQATRNKLYATLAAGARRAETFTTIVQTVSTKGASIGSNTPHTGEGTNSPPHPTIWTSRGGRSENPFRPDLFSPDSEWERVDPPRHNQPTPPPKGNEGKVRAWENTRTAHRPSKQLTQPEQQQTPCTIVSKNKLPFPLPSSSLVKADPIGDLLTFTPLSPSPSHRHAEIPKDNWTLTDTSTSTRITEWNKSVHRALREHEATTKGDPKEAESSQHTTQNSQSARMDSNAIARAFATIRDAIPGGVNYEGTTKTLASAPTYPSHQEPMGRMFSPHPTVPLPTVQESLLFSPLGASSTRHPPSHPVRDQSGTDQGYEAYNRRGQANMYEEAALKAALEHEYKLKDEELRRKAEKVDATIAAAQQQQQQYETVNALEKQNRELLLLLRQKDTPAPAPTPAPAFAPQIPRPPSGAIMSALTQEIAQLKSDREGDCRRIAELEETNKASETLVESAKKSQSHSAKQASEAIIRCKESDNKLAEYKARLQDLEKRCHDAERRARDAENARKEISHQLNIKSIQLKSTQTERESWEMKSRQSNNEYTKLADKLKQVRMENAGLFARLEENSGKKNFQEENLVRDKKGLKEALIKERADSDRLRGERTVLQEKLQKTRQQLALAQARLQARGDGGEMATNITALSSVSQASFSLPEESDQKPKLHAEAKGDKEEEVIEDGQGSKVLPIRKGNEGWSEADLGGSDEVDSVSTMPVPNKNETQAIKKTITSPPLRALNPYSLKPLTPSMSRLIFPEKRTTKQDLLKDSPSPRLSAPSLRVRTEAKSDRGDDKTEASIFDIMSNKTKTNSAPKAELISTIDPFADLGAAIGLGMTLPPTPAPKKETFFSSPKFTTNTPPLL